MSGVAKPGSSEAPDPDDNSGDADRRPGGYITEKDMHAAVWWLMNSTTERAQAKANLHRVVEFRKIRLARLMRKRPELAVNAQEREAWATEDMEEQIEAEAQAHEANERLKNEEHAKGALIEAWRTQSSNERAVRL